VPTFFELTSAAESELGVAGVDTPRLDAEVLLAHCAGLSRAGLIARFRDRAPESVAAALPCLVDARCRRQPVAYLVGEKEFYSLSFRVTSDVLIPRPETELLVEAALARMPAGALVCDVGTGSGCIAVALASQAPAARLVACDLSSAALLIAAENARRHGVDDRVELVLSDLFAAVDVARRFDVVVSNPPYVATAAALDAELDWEPEMALRAGREGMDVIEPLLTAARSRLRPGGVVMVEIGADQERAARRAARAAGYATVDVRRDLAGLPRLVVAEAGV